MGTSTRMLCCTLAGVVLLHVGLLGWLWQMQPANRPPNVAAPALLTRWLEAPAPRRLLALAPSATARSAATAPRKAAAIPRVAPGVPAEPLVAVSPVATPAAEPMPAPTRWADSIQRAARQSARRPGIAEVADAQIGARDAGKADALQAGMASAAVGDCLKGGNGGYAGQGLGLFALPVLMFDVARGRCAK